MTEHTSNNHILQSQAELDFSKDLADYLKTKFKGKQLTHDMAGEMQEAILEYCQEVIDTADKIDADIAAYMAQRKDNIDK